MPAHWFGEKATDCLNRRLFSGTISITSNAANKLPQHWE
jgi:hypothetical protein